MTTIELKTKNYNEAVRYMENVTDALKKAKKNGKFYEDDKYTRTACGIAYNAVLLALDTYFTLKNKSIIKKNHQRKNVDDYKRILSEIDTKLLKEYQNAYNVLHLDGYYDGITKYDTLKSGMDSAVEIINKIKPVGLFGLKIA